MVINLKENSNIRKIDDLGRIVIPRDIRKKLHISNNDTLEIYIEDNSIILAKYSVIDNNIDKIKYYLDNINRITSNNYLITNNEYILASDIIELENSNIPTNIKQYLLDTNKKPSSIEIQNKVYLQNEFNIVAINVDGHNQGAIIELINNRDKTDSVIRLLRVIIEEKLNNY